MAGELSRVTVVGTRKRVDVAVPASTPIGEYTARLARMCGQDRDPMLPPAWSLAVAGDEPFPLSASLAELSVGDGQVLYLRDLAREPGEAPMVEDIEELVANETLNVRKQMMRSGYAVLGLGLLWTVGAAVWLSAHAAGVPAAIGLTVVGLLVIGLAWSLSQRGRGVPRPLRVAVALTSLPCFAVAGEMVAESLGGPGFRWAGIVAGANLAVLMALATLADPVVAVAAIQLAVAGAAIPLLMSVGATRVDAAAFAVVVSVGLLGLSRRTAAMMAAWAARSMATRPSAAAATGDLVDESGRILALLLLLPAGAMVVAVPILATSGEGFAIALAAVGSLGLLARARLAGFTAELLILAATGVVGLFFVVAGIASMLSMSAFAETGTFLVCAVVLTGIGVGLSLFGPTDPTLPSETKPPRRRTRAEVLSTMCAVVTAPLAMGVFGMLGDLVTIGRNLF